MYKMETIITKFLEYKVEYQAALTKVKSNMVEFKSAEAKLKKAMDLRSITHIHVKQYSATLNRSIADKSIRVYNWKLLYSDDEMEQDTAITEALEFMQLRLEKMELQDKRLDVERKLKDTTHEICSQFKDRVLVKESGRAITLDVWPQANRVKIFRHRKAPVSTC
jgi:hypothetical protein